MSFYVCHLIKKGTGIFYYLFNITECYSNIKKEQMFDNPLYIEQSFVYTCIKNKCSRTGEGSKIMINQEVYIKDNYIVRRTTRKKNRIYSKTRFCIFIISVMLLTFLAVGLLVNLDSAAGMENREYKVVKIQSGDTLWNIASSYTPDGMDVRDYIYAICDANEIKNKTIYPDQDLKLPIL